MKQKEYVQFSSRKCPSVWGQWVSCLPTQGTLGKAWRHFSPHGWEEGCFLHLIGGGWSYAKSFPVLRAAPRTIHQNVISAKVDLV